MEAARPSLRQNLRSLPPAAWVLFGGTFVNRLGTFVMPFIVLYLTGKGFSVPQAGLALAMYGIGGVAAQFLGGWLADRIGRKNAIGFSMLGASVITLLLWQASSLPMIYALMLLLALVAEMHRPAASALIADLVPSEQRVAAFAVFRLAINVGWACGLTLGGLLADRSFSYLFIGDAARDPQEIRAEVVGQGPERGPHDRPEREHHAQRGLVPAAGVLGGAVGHERARHRGRDDLAQGPDQDHHRERRDRLRDHQGGERQTYQQRAERDHPRSRSPPRPGGDRELEQDHDDAVQRLEGAVHRRGEAGLLDVQRERRHVLHVDRRSDQDRAQEQEEPAIGHDRAGRAREVAFLLP